MNLIALNKPFGTICQFSAHETRPSLGDWVKTPGVYAAGRLDADSEGCCCSPTTVRCRRASPSRATSSSSATGRRSRRARPADLKALARGVDLGDYVTRPCRAEFIEPPDTQAAQSADPHRAAIPTTWIELAITEGKNRQVRRMTAAVGFRRCAGARRHRRTRYIRARHCTGRNNRTAATRTVGGFRARRMTNSGRANFSSSFSSTGCEDRALNHADANLSYPALAAEPVFASRKRRFIEYDSAPAAQ